MSDKKVELGLQINTAEFRGARTYVREMVDEFKRLNMEVAKFSSAGRGTGSGAGGGSAFSAGASSAGAGKGGGQGGGAAGPMSGIGAGMSQVRDQFKGATAEIIAGMRGLTSAIEGEAAKQARALGKLRPPSLSDLAGEWGRGGGGGGSGGGGGWANNMGGLRGPDTNWSGGVSGAIAREQAHRASSVANWERGFAQLQAQGRAAESAQPGGMLGAVGGIVQRFTGLNPVTAGLAGAGIYGARMAYKTVESGISENETAPWNWMRRAQMVGSSAGQVAQQAHYGNFNRALTRKLIAGDAQFSADRAAIGTGLETSVSGFQTTTSGGTSLDAAGWRRDKIALGAAARTVTGDPLGAINQAKQAVTDLPYKTVKEQYDFDAAYEASHQDRYNAANHLQAAYRGNMSNMRLWMSGERRNPNSNYGGAVLNGGVNRARSFETRGLSEEAAQAMHGVEAIAGSGTGLRGAGRLAGAIAGHLYAAPQIYGQAAMGGDPGDFFSATQNLIGRGSGGMDVQAGGRLGSIASGAIMSGSGFTSGLGLLGAMSKYAGGSSAAGDMANTAFAQQGLGNLDRMTKGNLDPYQAGVNLLAAAHHAPKIGVFGQEYLAGMDFRQMADVVGGAAMPGDLKSLGISRDMVKGVFGEQQRRMLDRDIAASPGQEGQLNPMQAMLRRLRGHDGDFGALVKSEKLKGAGLEDAFSQYGTWLSTTGQADNYQTGVSMARTLAGTGTMAETKRRAGRGAGDAAAGGIDQSFNAAKSEEIAKDERELQERNALYRPLATTLGQQVATERNVQQQLNGGTIPNIGRVNEELGNLADVIRKRAMQIAGVGPGERRAVQNAGPSR